jgi:hypothetical protein
VHKERQVVGKLGLMRREVRPPGGHRTRQRHRPTGPHRGWRAPGLGGPFVILEFDGDPAIVHLENRRGSASPEKDDDIAEAKRVAAPETNRAHPRRLVGSAG